jgi:non-homologous end joining protein Ku
MANKLFIDRRTTSFHNKKIKDQLRAELYNNVGVKKANKKNDVGGCAR